jgi:hypothetical protein
MPTKKILDIREKLVNCCHSFTEGEFIEMQAGRPQLRYRDQNMLKCRPATTTIQRPKHVEMQAGHNYDTETKTC